VNLIELAHGGLHRSTRESHLKILLPCSARFGLSLWFTLVTCYGYQRAVTDGRIT